MISLDQVLLLEQKVESAVEKIKQLQSENDALRNKCAELTNALSAKSEQLSTFETDQNQIEDGIKKALDRLNFIENTVLKTVSKVNSQAALNNQKPILEQNNQNNQNVAVQTQVTTPSQENHKNQDNSNSSIQNSLNFNDMNTIENQEFVASEGFNNNLFAQQSEINDNTLDENVIDENAIDDAEEIHEEFDDEFIEEDSSGDDLDFDIF